MKTKLEETQASITISNGEALGDGFKCFNLPNNNCGIVKQDKKIMLCRDGAGKKHKECEDCDYNNKCEHIHFCCGATIICNNRCYENNTLTLDTRRILYKNYLASLQDNFVEKMKKEIELLKEEIHFFRIHSLGEFYCYEYFEKWMEIAKSFEDKKILFVAYTKCFEYMDKYIVDNRTLPKNVKIMLSLMPDSLYGTKAIIERDKGTEKSLRENKQRRIALIEKLMQNKNADIYYTSYDEVCEKVLQNNGEELLKELGLENVEPRVELQGCILHEGKKCADCMNENGMNAGCYVIDNRNRE